MIRFDGTSHSHLHTTRPGLQNVRILRLVATLVASAFWLQGKFQHMGDRRESLRSIPIRWISSFDPKMHRTPVFAKRNGRGSKLNRRGYAGFGPCFHLPGFHFGRGFLSHSQMARCPPAGLWASLALCCWKPRNQKRTPSFPNGPRSGHHANVAPT